MENNKLNIHVHGVKGQTDTWGHRSNGYMGLQVNRGQTDPCAYRSNKIHSHRSNRHMRSQVKQIYNGRDQRHSILYAESQRVAYQNSNSTIRAVTYSAWSEKSCVMIIIICWCQRLNVRSPRSRVMVSHARVQFIRVTTANTCVYGFRI